MMSSRLEQVLQAVMSLPELDRVQLVDALIATLEPEDAAPLDDALLAEIERRSNEVDAGTAVLASWDEVKAHARSRSRSDG
jgi:putative addiction module component (TIGR02574 family)